MKNAYNLLQEDTSLTCSNHHNYISISTNIWYLIWKVKLPIKIGNFIWELMHNCLPTDLTLKDRGIINNSTCPLCNSNEESTSHLFLYCSFARAMWHGTTLAVQTSEPRNIFFQDWIRIRIWLNKYKRMDDDSMHYLESIFTTLWTMWNCKNRVVCEGIQPNPIEVILTTQNLSCRYHNILTKDQQPSHQRV